MFPFFKLKTLICDWYSEIVNIMIYSCSYKFTLDKLCPLMDSVKLRSESYKEWLSSAQDIVENKGSKKKGAKD